MNNDKFYYIFPTSERRRRWRWRRESLMYAVLFSQWKKTIFFFVLFYKISRDQQTVWMRRVNAPSWQRVDTYISLLPFLYPKQTHTHMFVACWVLKSWDSSLISSLSLSLSFSIPKRRRSKQKLSNSSSIGVMSDVTGDLQLFLIVLFNSSPEGKQDKQVKINPNPLDFCLPFFL